jgi:hypothetical protein
MHIRNLALMTLVVLLVASGCTKSSAPVSSKRVFFVSPHDGDKVPSTFEVVFGVEGMKVRPAMEDPNDKTSGHHHLLIDNEKGYNETGEIVLKDEKNIHFGKGETQTTVTLTPGTHKLSLQFADGAHRSYGKEMSASITVTVQ